MAIKRIVFKEHDHNHAALVVKLGNMKVTQNDLFQFFVSLFISDSKCLVEFTEKLVSEKSRLGKKPRVKLAKHMSQGRASSSSLGLTDEERSDIFDILEKENFD